MPPAVPKGEAPTKQPAAISLTLRYAGKQCPRLCPDRHMICRGALAAVTFLFTLAINILPLPAKNERRAVVFSVCCAKATARRP